MTKHSLAGVRVAILAADGVEQVALTTPRAALDSAGAWTQLVAPLAALAQQAGHITAWNGDRWGAQLAVDVPLSEARAEEFDALLIPGGTMGAAALHANLDAIALVRAFDAQGKPVAAICHGASLLAAADIVRGRRVAAWPALQRDLRDAGATWVDSHVAVDGRLLTCRSPVDLASFMRSTIAELAGAGALATR